MKVITHQSESSQNAQNGFKTTRSHNTEMTFEACNGKPQGLNQSPSSPPNHNKTATKYTFIKKVAKWPSEFIKNKLLINSMLEKKENH